jgi:hypothetical protein
MNTDASAIKIQTPNTLEPNRQQHDRPTACGIAQQYSSPTFILLRFHCRKGKFDTRFNKCYRLNFLLFKIDCV